MINQAAASEPHSCWSPSVPQPESGDEPANSGTVYEYSVCVCVCEEFDLWGRLNAATGRFSSPPLRLLLLQPRPRPPDASGHEATAPGAHVCVGSVETETLAADRPASACLVKTWRRGIN